MASTSGKLTGVSHYWQSEYRSDPFYQSHFHLIISPGYLQGIYTVRKIVEPAPVQFLLVIFHFGFHGTTYKAGVIFENCFQEAFLSLVDLERKSVDEYWRFDF